MKILWQERPLSIAFVCPVCIQYMHPKEIPKKFQQTSKNPWKFFGKKDPFYYIRLSSQSWIHAFKISLLDMIHKKLFTYNLFLFINWNDHTAKDLKDHIWSFYVLREMNLTYGLSQYVICSFFLGLVVLYDRQYITWILYFFLAWLPSLLVH